MNNTLEGIKSRITEAEEWISDLEDIMVEVNAAKQSMIKWALFQGCENSSILANSISIKLSLSDPGIRPGSFALQADSLSSESPWKPKLTQVNI